MTLPSSGLLSGLRPPSRRYFIGTAVISCLLSLFIRYKILRYLLLRGLSEIFVLAVLLYFYLHFVSEHLLPFVKGRHLEMFDMMHTNHYQRPKFIDLGFSNLRKSVIDGVEFFKGEFWKYKHKNFSFCASQGFRPYMEDRMHFMNDPNNNIAIFGIFDGHGGQFVSDYLEANFTRAIRKRLIRFYSKRRYSIDSRMSEDDPISEALITEIHNIDDAISRLHNEETSLTGSTLIAVIVEQSRYLTVISVGDSRAVACDSRGVTCPLTNDHKPDLAAETRRITSAGGFVQFDGHCHRVQGILAVSRSFGDTRLKREGVLTAHPDVRRIDLVDRPLKFLIVGTDGFWDVIDNEEAVNFSLDYLRAHKGLSWHRVSEHLLKIALARRTKDNVSVLFIRF